MVISGEAGMQRMGDWARGEFLKAGKVPGTDFVCIRFPGTQGAVKFNSDQFAMFAQTDPAKQEAQVAMAKAIMVRGFQSAFVILAHLAIKSYDRVVALTGGGRGRSTEMPATFMYSCTCRRNQMGIGASSAVIMVPYIHAELRQKK